MGRKKKTRGVAVEANVSPSFLRSIISSVPFPDGRDSADLKRLHAALVHLSLNSHFTGSTISHSDLFYRDVVEIQDLSHVLFKELDQGFEEVFSALHDVSASKVAAIWAKREQLMLVFRCCLVLLVLLAFNQLLLIEKGRIVFSNLKRLISAQLVVGQNNNWSIKLKRSLSLECASVDGDCTASFSEEFVASEAPLHSPLCNDLLCSLLEVFANELLLHESLGDYFMLINSSSSRNERLFNFPIGHGSIGSALEVIYAHFILSVFDEQTFAKSNKLYWCNGEDSRTPEISFSAALSLLLSPVLSAPKLFQAHLISLVAETINICTTENVILDQSMVWYLTAFERSVILYGRHLSSLDTQNHCFSGEGFSGKSCFLGNNQPHFGSFLLPVTVEKLDHLVANSHRAWGSYVSKVSFGKDSDPVGPSIAYVNDNMCIFDDAYKHDALLILNCIILGCSSGDTGGSVLWKGETNLQDMCFLASVLKLMSCSLLQIVKHVKQVAVSSPLKSKLGVTSSKDFKVILENIISHFQQFSVQLPVQNFLSKEVESHLAVDKENKRMMLLHLLGVLSLSYSSGMDFLVKGCLFMIMTLLNLFIIDEGDLSALVQPFISASKSFSSETSEKVEEVPVARKSSLLISSKVQNIQNLYLRQAEMRGCSAANSVADENVEACNGETYLKCVLGENSKVDDFDDLADFIECKAGKDYSGWLKDREKYRQWKYEKRISLRWKKRKKQWHICS